MGVGQKVVCIEGYESYGDKLIEGKIYTIQGISGCPCEPAYNVGIIPSGFAQTMCYSCRNEIGGRNEWWHRASRFVPLEEMEAHNEAIKELFKELEICQD